MIRILALLLFMLFSKASAICFCFYSSSAQDGGVVMLNTLGITSTTALSQVGGVYSQIKMISAGISKASSNKKQIFENITRLSKANAVKEQKIQFEYERYKKLLSVYNDVEGLR